MMTKLTEVKYPYLWAWGYRVGAHDDYMDSEAGVAEKDHAPADVIYARTWTQMTTTDREVARNREIAGTVFIARDKLGKPVRAWYRFRGVLRRDTRDEVIAIVDRLKAGRSPWG